MNWNNLMKNKCPKCGKELDFKSDKDMMMCTISCGFMIETENMKKICVQKARQTVDKKELIKDINLL